MKIAIIGLALSVMVAPAWADKPEWADKSKEKQEYRKGEHSDRDDREYRGSERHETRTDARRLSSLTERERYELRDIVLREHYGVRPEGGHYRGLPPGLQKKLERGGRLPPGWQDKVRRGEVLDAELYRSGERLPREYLDRLGHGSEAAELILLGDRIVRVAEGRGTVLDVVELTDKAMDLLGN
ncbi:hypothetical protein CLV44_101203 [Marinobacterium halophilum]|uniref:Nickel/cobalt transporter regulator n=1 Tax=Marinobacterium halophilum TaxID=267374 RepID=A0A2P8F517_9GAMM|nr:hypothetical protein [Marinobacterium halophilum]PSL16803.1 hypothetical protein CLV44_101203 [Marinobacterium halophilum]